MEQAVKATTRFFQRGMGAGELSLADASSLQVATGVNLRSNPTATAALQRLMKRPGGFSDPEGEQDRAVLAAAGVDVTNKRTADRIAGVFKRPGVFAELSEEEVSCNSQNSHLNL